MIKGILFDYDGTLSKRYEAVYHMYRYMMHRECPEIDEHSLAFETMVQRCLLWDAFGTEPKDKVFGAIKEKLIPGLDIQEWKEIWLEKFSEYQIVMPEVKRVLSHLHQHYRLGILSNGDEKSQLSKIRHTGIEQWFDVIIATGTYGIDKPDPKIYRIAAEQMGLQMEEIAFVGDTFATDIAGAIAVGMKPIWYCSERKGISEYPVKQVKDFDEIEHLFIRDEK